MTKADFIKAVKTELGDAITSADIGKVLDAAAAVALATLKQGHDMPLLGLGSVKVVQRAARSARNPRTGALVKVPAKKTAKLSVSKTLKDALQ